jgi:enoyl-CoA hydratase
MDMANVLQKQLENGILELRLNRPDRLNALNEALTGELAEVFRDLNHNREVRVVILTGEGRGFCAGADLQASGVPGSIPGTKGMSQLGYVYKYQEYLADMILAIHECDKPVIAAVNGAAVGGGLAIALASDIRIACEHAKFGAAFIKVGLSSCDVGTSYLLPRIVGISAASEMMLTGRNISAEEALRLQLVSHLVTADALAETALEIARAIALNSEYGVWMTKKGLRANLDAASLRHAMELENRTQVLGFFTGGMEEAMLAFQEGRVPRWPSL